MWYENSYPTLQLHSSILCLVTVYFLQNVGRKHIPSKCSSEIQCIVNIKIGSFIQVYCYLYMEPCILLSLWQAESSILGVSIWFLELIDRSSKICSSNKATNCSLWNTKHISYSNYQGLWPGLKPAVLYQITKLVVEVKYCSMW